MHELDSLGGMRPNAMMKKAWLEVVKENMKIKDSMSRMMRMHKNG